MQKTVYSVKRCLTKGVVQLQGVVDDNGIFHPTNSFRASDLVMGKEAFYNRQKALQVAELMKQKQISLLRQRIQFFEEIEFT